jgi:Beta-galactosidase
MPKDRNTSEIKIKRWVPVAIVAGIILFVFGFNVIRDNIGMNKPIKWGVTFSESYAKDLGLDWQQVFIATLDDLGVKNYRIAVAWDAVEPADGNYDFRDVDWMLDQAEERNAKAFLAIGRRTPRWPECHTPDWAKTMSLADQNQKLLDLLRAEVGHFKNRSTVTAWQVENEPLLDVFGVCPPGDIKLLSEEIQLVKTLDPSRPVIVTDSGELSFWVRTGWNADILGISMYRETWNKWLGYFYYPITPAFYRQKAAAVYPIVKKVIVTELQAEPWPAHQTSIPQTPIAEQYKSMNIQRFRDNVEFARRVGFPEVYLWGVEWWYWIRERGDSSFWNEAKNLFAENKNTVTQ